MSRLSHYAFGIALCLSIAAQANANRPERGERPEPPSFAELDLDGDGAVDYEEFLASEVPNNDHDVIFSHIDADQDGYLSEDEVTNHEPPERGERGQRGERR